MKVKKMKQAWKTGWLGLAALAVWTLIAVAPAHAGGAGEIGFDDVPFQVLEEGGVAIVVIERSRGEDGAVTIDYATVAGGTATAGVDYTPISGTLSWGDGDETDRTVMVPILDDSDPEGAETILMELSNPTGGAIIRAGRGTTSVTILESDGGTGTPPPPPPPGGGGGNDFGEIGFDEDTFQVIEEGGVAIVVVERSRGEDGAVSIDYASVPGGTATSGVDYTPVSGTLTWGDGDGTNRTFTVPLIDDTDPEGSETILLELSNPTGGAIIRAGRGSSSVVILASDGGTGNPPPPPGGGGNDPGFFKFDQRDFITLEGTPMAVISVERSNGEDGAVTVEYATADGTATEGADYTGAFGTLSWADGDGSAKTFLIPILDDALSEGDETVELSLHAPTGGATIDPVRGTATLTILDDETGGGGQPPVNPPPGGGNDPGVFKFDLKAFQTVEGVPTALISIERSNGEDGAVTVDFETSDGSATAGLDYAATSTTLAWGNGDGSTRFVEIPIFDDTLSEGNETVQLTLFNPTGGAGLDPTRSTATLTILDNDGQTTACQAGPNTLCLLGGRFKAEVDWRTRQGNTGEARAIEVSDNSGLFWFFNQRNIEMLVKVLDACGQPFDRYWVFFAATTNVDFTVRMTDTRTGVVKEYLNPLGLAAAPIQDTVTFDTCP